MYYIRVFGIFGYTDENDKIHIKKYEKICFTY